MEFLDKWEGGWSDNPRDPGGATMRGITLATYTAWQRAHGKPTPTKEDLRNISDKDRAAIYEEWYYKASGADKLPYPLCLAHFDLAVNGGVGRANQALANAGGSFEAYNNWRRAWYRRLPDFDTFGNGWLNRVNDLERFVQS